MPSAHPDLVKMWGGAYYLIDGKQEYFECGEEKAISFLMDRGYALGRDWCWTHPVIKTYKDMEHEEYDAMWFLVTEWDYGGLNEARPL